MGTLMSFIYFVLCYLLDLRLSVVEGDVHVTAVISCHVEHYVHHYGLADGA